MPLMDFQKPLKSIAKEIMIRIILNYLSIGIMTTPLSPKDLVKTRTLYNIWQIQQYLTLTMHSGMTAKITNGVGI